MLFHTDAKKETSGFLTCKNDIKYGAEGFQRAIGKPFGRARRRETFPVCKSTMCILQKKTTYFVNVLLCPISNRTAQTVKKRRKKSEGPQPLRLPFISDDLVSFEITTDCFFHWRCTIWLERGQWTRTRICGTWRSLRVDDRLFPIPGRWWTLRESGAACARRGHR